MSEPALRKKAQLRQCVDCQAFLSLAAFYHSENHCKQCKNKRAWEKEKAAADLRKGNIRLVSPAAVLAARSMPFDWDLPSLAR